MLMLPAAGMRLSQWARINPSRMAENFIRIYVHLLEGMFIYQNAGYVHNDIHEGNILIDEHGVARFIDFGKSFRPATVKKLPDINLFISFNPLYIMTPPEVHAWKMMVNGISLRSGVEQLRILHEEYRQLEIQFPARPSALAALHSFMIEDRYVTTGDFGGFVRAYGMRFDCWRIGICMWTQWNDLMRSSGFRTSPLWNHQDRMRRVIGGLTEFDPRRRWTVRRALAELDPGNRMAAAGVP